MHLAQANVATMIAGYDDPLMADFVAELDTVNATADEAPGFVWRFIEEDDGAKWFEKPARSPFVLWWIEEGHLPTVEEARDRLEMLWESGPTPAAFTFRSRFASR